MLSKPTWLLGITGPCWGDIAVAMMGLNTMRASVCLNKEQIGFLRQIVRVALVVHQWSREQLGKKSFGKQLKGGLALAYLKSNQRIA